MAYVKTGLLDPFKDHTDMKFPRSAGFMGYYKYPNKLKDIKIQ